MLKLSFPTLVDVRYHVHSIRDRRRVVDYWIYEYLGSDGERYRKAFETECGMRPHVIDGTHEEINRTLIQRTISLDQRG